MFDKIRKRFRGEKSRGFMSVPVERERQRKMAKMKKAFSKKKFAYKRHRAEEVAMNYKRNSGSYLGF